MKRWTEVIDKWEFASILCASGHAFWMQNIDGLHLFLRLNSTLTEEVTEAELHEVWQLWKPSAVDKGAALVEWVRAKREKQG